MHLREGHTWYNLSVRESHVMRDGLISCDMQGILSYSAVHQQVDGDLRGNSIKGRARRIVSLVPLSLAPTRQPKGLVFLAKPCKRHSGARRSTHNIEQRCLRSHPDTILQATTLHQPASLPGDFICIRLTSTTRFALLFKPTIEQ
jgi:hypothetical protein